MANGKALLCCWIINSGPVQIKIASIFHVNEIRLVYTGSFVWQKIMKGWIILCLLILVISVSADVDHTVAYRKCNSSSVFDSDACTFYTDVYFTGTYTVFGTDNEFTIDLVGTPSDPTRTGNAATCGTDEQCTKTTHTTIKVTSVPTNVVTYTLTSLGFTIPWQYYLTSKYTPPLPPTLPPNCLRSSFKISTSSVQADHALFGNAGSFCVSQADYTLSPGPYSTHPGPAFPPSNNILDEYPNNAAFATSCSINKCPRTTQYISGVDQSGVPFVDSYCDVDTSDRYVAYYYLQEINPYSGTSAIDNVAQCNIYKISDPVVNNVVTVTVQSELGNETIDYTVTDGGTVVIPLAAGNGKLAVTGQGTKGLTSPDANPYYIEDGALLIECTPYDGGRSNVSVPTGCSSFDSYDYTNYIFYVPPEYAGYYDNTAGYGASTTNILYSISVDNAIDYLKYDQFSMHIPGYPNKGGRLYNGATPSADCAAQSTTTPEFDAQKTCYKSVSPATMFDAHANDINQWFLPGTYHDSVEYAIDWSDPVTGASLVQTVPASANVTLPTYTFSLLIEIADTLMAYITSPEQTAVVDNAQTSCFYSYTNKKIGQYKLTVCNGGDGTNDITPTVYTVVSYCDSGLNITNNSTLDTVPLSLGDCQGIIYSLSVNSSVFTPTPSPVPANENDTDNVSPAPIPFCYSSIYLKDGGAQSPVMETVVCIDLPSSASSGFPFLAVFLSVGIVVAVVVLFLFLCCYQRASRKKESLIDDKKKK